MKKLFFVALMAGLFGVQSLSAQYSADNASLEFTLFQSGSSDYAVITGDNIVNRCVEVKEASGGNSAITSVGANFVYTIDASGQRYRGTLLLGSPNTAFLPAFQGGNFYRLYTRENNRNISAENLTE